jgi:hypothetical protein
MRSDLLRHRTPGARCALVVIAAIAVAACAPAAASRQPPLVTRQIPVPPDARTYFGTQLDWIHNDTPQAYASRLGKTPFVYGRFVPFPFSDANRAQLIGQVAEVAAMHSNLFLTLMPDNGLDKVTSAVAFDLARLLADWNARGVMVFVRFGQEMNGSWYPWGQHPVDYVRAFTSIADAVHAIAPRTVMVWSPNYGGGYPFVGGRFPAQQGNADFAALDTNHDGRLTMDDDPYGPYYPGDEYVDWVGLTLYHWGGAWPWGHNDIPETNKFVNQLTGKYNGLNGNDSMIPDFYATYAVGHHKPMALSETSSLYNEAQAGHGASNLELKSNWMGQVFDKANEKRFPLLKMENWFELEKQEEGIAGTVDWRATTDPQVLAALRAALTSRFIFA